MYELCTHVSEYHIKFWSIGKNMWLSIFPRASFLVVFYFFSLCCRWSVYKQVKMENQDTVNTLSLLLSKKKSAQIFWSAPTVRKYWWTSQKASKTQQKSFLVLKKAVWWCVWTSKTEPPLSLWHTCTMALKMLWILHKQSEPMMRMPTEMCLLYPSLQRP